MYDYLIVTHLPAFYKVNLYNELAKKLNIFVVFVANDTADKRSSDFTSITNAHFKYTVLSEQAFQNRSKLMTLRKLAAIICKTQYKKILVNGWDLPEFWLSVIISSNRKNCLALESTVIDSNAQGLTGLIKRAFLGMVSTVFASGDLHVELLKKLNYKKAVKVTRGVGIINKPAFEYQKKAYEKKFLYIGRLSKVKNLEMLVRVFNDLPEHQLTIIGDGEEKEFLKSVANKNILFISAIENSKLKEEFKKSNIFILPSIREPWGLVVEEALYFAMPVIVSKCCGASELVKDNINGFTVDPNSKKEISSAIQKIDSRVFSALSKNIVNTFIEEKDCLQVDAYIKNEIR